MPKNTKLITFAIAGLALTCAVSSTNPAFAKKDKKKKGAAADSAMVKKDTIAALPQAPLVTPGFTKTPSGLEYRMLNDAPGRNIQVGNYIEMHIQTRYHDSMLFSSRKMNGNQPVPYKVQPPQFNGDLAEGFTFLSAGDSALFLIPIDSMAKSGNQLPPMIETGKGNKLEYLVTIVTARTEEEMQKDMAERTGQQQIIDSQLLTSYFAQKKLKPMRTPSGIYYTIAKKGLGAKPVSGDSVCMNYTGALLDGKKFDSNVDSSFRHVQPFWFNLDQHQVIRGWDEGVAMLNQGTKATLYIPSALGYGPQSPGPQIPANSILVFDVEVKKVVKPGGSAKAAVKTTTKTTSVKTKTTSHKATGK